MKLFPKILSVNSHGKYKIWLKYDDQIQGIVDLGELAKKGIFQIWEEDNNFDKVYIDKISGAVAWNEDLDICPDSLYLRLLNISFEEFKERNSIYATN